jgi:hypothetical protein
MSHFKPLITYVTYLYHCLTGMLVSAESYLSFQSSSPKLLCFSEIIMFDNSYYNIWLILRERCSQLHNVYCTVSREGDRIPRNPQIQSASLCLCTAHSLIFLSVIKLSMIFLLIYVCNCVFLRVHWLRDVTDDWVYIVYYPMLPSLQSKRSADWNI